MIFFFQSLDMAAEGLLADIEPLRCSGKFISSAVMRKYSMLLIFKVPPPRRILLCYFNMFEGQLQDLYCRNMKKLLLAFATPRCYDAGERPADRKEGKA